MTPEELTGAALDWAVAKCEEPDMTPEKFIINYRSGFIYAPSTDWAQGGPIIEREKITTDFYPDGCHPCRGIWCAQSWDENGNATAEEIGDSFLEACMRCYVASKLGDEVSVPEKLS